MRFLRVVLFCVLGIVFLAQSQETNVLPDFQGVMNRFNALQSLHANNLKAMETLPGDIREIPKSLSSEEFLEKALMQRKRVNLATQALLREQEEQVNFKSELSRYQGSRQLLQQEKSYLYHYNEELQKQSVDCEAALGILKRMWLQLNQQIAKVEPPVSFQSEAGIEFVVVRNGKGGGFYIMKRPLSADQYRCFLKRMNPAAPDAEIDHTVENFTKNGLSFPEAKKAAAVFGRMSGFPCALPTSAQTALLKGYEKDLTQALWLEDKSNGDVAEKDRRIRFRMEMAQVWDPAGCLSAVTDERALYSELPWASYPELGCAFVVPLECGRNALLAMVEKRIVSQVVEEAVEAERKEGVEQ